MHHNGRMRRLFIALAVVLILAPSCHRDDGGDTSSPTTAPGDVTGAMISVTAATTAAGGLKLTGTSTATAPGAPDQSGPIDGVVDAKQGDVHLPVFTGGSMYNVQVRWTGPATYINRGVDPSATADTFSMFVRTAADKPWALATGPGVRQLVVGSVDPFVALRLMATPGTTVAGTEDHDGKTWTRYQRATTQLGAGAGAAATTPGAPSATQPPGTLEIWVDAGQVLRKVTSTSATRTFTYDVAPGATVQVAAPGPDEIARPPSLAAAASAEPAGEFASLGTGTMAGTAWNLLRAPATKDGVCVRLDLTPTGGAVQPGTVSCQAGPNPDPTPEDVIQFAVNTPAGQPVNGVAVVYPGGTDPKQIGFADREVQPLAPAGPNFAVWVGPAEPQAVFISLTYTGGIKLGCGSGSLTSLSDLDQLVEQLPQMRTAPWTCVEL